MTVEGRYDGKVAVVTGAASGIGRATATRLVAEGAMVVGGDVNTDGLNDLAARLGERFASQRCDVTIEGDVAGLVAYLASDAAGFLTGQTLVLDGGLTIVSPLSRLEEAR